MKRKDKDTENSSATCIFVFLMVYPKKIFLYKFWDVDISSQKAQSLLLI